MREILSLDQCWGCHKPGPPGPGGQQKALGRSLCPQATPRTPHPPCLLHSLHSFIPTQPRFGVSQAQNKIPERPRPCPRLNSPGSEFLRGFSAPVAALTQRLRAELALLPKKSPFIIPQQPLCAQTGKFLQEQPPKDAVEEQEWFLHLPVGPGHAAGLALAGGDNFCGGSALLFGVSSALCG